jgi:hypothetical protein
VRVPKLWAVVVWLGGGLLYSCVVSWLPCRFAPRECLVQKRRKSTPQVATLQLYRGDPQNRRQVLGTPARPHTAIAPARAITSGGFHFR